MTATAVKEFIYERPWLYPKQRDAIFAPERYVVVEASTKSGKTVGCMAWLLEEALKAKAGQACWWVAPIFPQAKIAFRRMKRGLPQELYDANESELTITLPHGVTIFFKGADKPDSLYGEDVVAAVIDEASRCKEDAWYAVRSTLTATRGRLRVIGNVKGRKNWAYKLGRKALSGEPGYLYAKITAHDAAEAGVLQSDEIEDARRSLPENVFNELYLAEASDDEGNPFGIQAIRDRVAPLSDSAPVAYGIDLAKSVDWTVIVGLDSRTAVCRFKRFQKPWRDTLREIRDEVGDVPALVDSTGVGDPILEELQAGRGDYEGLKYTQRSKQQLMEGLALVIQQQEISYPEGPIVDELEAFEYVYTRSGVYYSAPEGMHDDCVNALALAVARARNTFAVTDDLRQLFKGYGEYRGK